MPEPSEPAEPTEPPEPPQSDAEAPTDPAASFPARKGRSRWRKLGLFVLVGLPLATGVTALTSWLFLRTSWGNSVLREVAETQVGLLVTGGDFELGGLKTDLWRHLSLSDVHLTADDGTEVLGAGSVELEWNVLPLLRGRVEAPTVRVEGLVLDLVQDDEGLLNLSRLFGTTEVAEPSTEPWGGLPVDIVAEGIEVDNASIRYRFGSQDWGGDGLTGTLDVHGTGRRIEIGKIDLRGTLKYPAEEPVEARGEVVYTGDSVDLTTVDLVVGTSKLHGDGSINLTGEETGLAVGIDAQPLDLGTIDHLFGEPGLAGTYAGRVRLDGPMSAVVITGQLEGVGEASGRLVPELTLNLADGRVPWSGKLVAEGFDVVAFYPGAGKDIMVSGTFRGEGGGITWPDDLNVSGTFQPTAVQVLQYELTGGLVPLEIAGGVLRLSGGVVGTPYGTYSASGTVGLVKGPIALDVTGEVVASELSRLGVSDLEGVGPISARVSGNWKEEGMPIRAQGHVALDNFAYTKDVTFRQMDAGFDVRLRDGNTFARADVVGVDGVTYGVKLDEVLSPDVDATIWKSGVIEALGNATVSGIEQTGTLEVTTASGPYTFTSKPNREPAATAELLLGSLTLMDLPASHGRATVNMADGAIGFNVDLDDGPRDMVETRGTYTLADASVVMSRLNTELVVGARLDSIGEQRLRLTDEGFDDMHLHLKGSAGEVLVDGLIGMTGTSDATFRTTQLDLEAIDRILKLEQGVAGRLDANGSLSGSSAAPMVSLRLTATGLNHPSLSGPIDVSGPVRVADGDVDIDLQLADGDTKLLRVDGLLGVGASFDGVVLGPRQPIDLEVTIDPGAWSRFEPLLPPPGVDDNGVPEDPIALPVGIVSGTIDVEGLMGDPRVAIRGVTELDVPNLYTPARAEFRGDRVGGETEFWIAAYEGTHLASVVRGTTYNRLEDTLAWALGDGAEPVWDDLDSFMDDLDVVVDVRDVDAHTLAVLSDAGVPLDGDMSGIITLKGRPSGPTVDVDLDWREAEVGAASLGRIDTRLERDGEGYALALGVEDPTVVSGEPALVVEGRVPLGINLNHGPSNWGTGSWDLALSGEGLPLELLSAVDPAITEGKGRMAVTGTVVGDFLDPQPDVEVAVQGGELVYRELNLRAKHIQLKASATNTLVSLKNLAFDSVPAQEGILGRSIGAVEDTIEGGQCGGRNVRVRGSIRLDDWVPSTVSLTTCLNSALVSATEDVYLKVSGTTDRQGTAITVSNRWPELQVGGSMVVERAQVVQDAASFYESAPLEVDSLINIHRSNSAAMQELNYTVPEAPFYAPFDVDIDVDLGQATQATVLMPFFAEYGQLVGDFSRVDVKARVSGNVNAKVTNASMALYGGVDLEDGSVRFLTRSFELNDGSFVFTGTDYANPRISIDASTSIQGATVNLGIDGTPAAPQVAFTSPEYSDPNQVFTLVLLGTRPETASSNDAASQLLALASSTAISTLLANEGLSSRGFTVSWDPDGAARVGVPVGRKVYGEVIYRPQNDTEVNQTAFSAQVRPFPNGVVEGTWGNRNSWVEVFWETRW